MNPVRYIGVSAGSLLAGAIVGGLGGLLWGRLLVAGYHRRGPSDPGDAPVYFVMGLILLAACVGAMIGLAGGIIYSVRLARKETTLDSDR